MLKRIGNIGIGGALLLLVMIVDHSLENDMTQDERDTRTFVKWWGIAFLFLALIILLQGCVHVNRGIAPITEDGTTVIVRVGDWPSNAIGMTTCTKDNKPIIVLRDVPMDERDRKIILAHEMQHVAQMKGDCRAVQELYRVSLPFRQQMELEAYCEDSKFALSLGADMELVARRLKGIMKQLYDLDDAKCTWQPP